MGATHCTYKSTPSTHTTSAHGRHDSDTLSSQLRPPHDLVLTPQLRPSSLSDPKPSQHPATWQRNRQQAPLPASLQPWQTPPHSPPRRPPLPSVESASTTTAPSSPLTTRRSSRRAPLLAL